MGHVWKKVIALRSSMGSDATITLFEKADDGFCLDCRDTLFQSSQCLTDIKIVVIDRFVCLLNGGPVFCRDSCTPQANAVQANDAGGVTIAGNIRRDVFHHFRATGNHGVIANKAELVYRYQAGDKDSIAQFHMARDGAVGAEYVVIAEMTIMASMEATHEVVVVTDQCSPFCLNAATDVDPFFEMIVVANYQWSAFFYGEPQVLRFAAEYSTVVYPVILAKLCTLEDTYTTLNFAITPNYHIGFDNRIGAYLHAVVKLGALINKGGRMNVHEAYWRLRVLLD